MEHCLLGVGLRSPHYPYLRENTPKHTKWFEAISENYMDSFGAPLKMLEFIRARFPVALHGVSMSIASPSGVDDLYLKRLRNLVDRIDPFCVSDHLCFTKAKTHNSHDLLPFPFTNKILEVVCNNIHQAQEALNRPLTLENVSSYLRFKDDEYSEWDFLKEIRKRTSCYFLFDINNLYVNSYNHKFDPEKFLNAIPTEAIKQLHIAGHTNYQTYLFDTHSTPVDENVWKLLDLLMPKIKDVPILLEWDDEIPDFETMEKEALKASKIWEKHHGKKYHGKKHPELVL